MKTAPPVFSLIVDGMWQFQLYRFDKESEHPEKNAPSNFVLFGLLSSGIAGKEGAIRDCSEVHGMGFSQGRMLRSKPERAGGARIDPAYMFILSPERYFSAKNRVSRLDVDRGQMGLALL